MICRITELLVTKCNAGYYFSADDNKCKECPTGTVSAAGAQSCTICPAGQFEFRHLVCKNCRAGKYSEGMTNKCTPCGVGKVSPAKSPACTDCIAGEYANHVDNMCKICPKNKYSKKLADSCTPCAAGTYSNAGASECHACVPGQYLDPVLLCKDCSPSYYSTNPSVGCKKCPAGKYSAGKATSCRQCAKGLFVNPAQTGCEATRTTPAPTASPTRPECPANQEYSDTLKICIDCKAGWGTRRNSLGVVECHPCPPNYSSPKAGSQCELCYPYNKVTNAEKTKCELCPPSFFPRHYLQGNDTYLTRRQDECIKCPEDTYSSPSVDAYYNYDTNCKECPYGQKVNAAQTGCEVDPYPKTGGRLCGPGLEVNYDTMQCRKCKVGYEKEFSFLKSCVPCPIGHVAYYEGTAKCKFCDEWTGYVVSPDRAYCETCKPSFYKQKYPLGDYPYTNAKNAECVKCPKGTYTTSDTGGADHCRNCANGLQVNDEQTGCGKPTQKPTPHPTSPPRGPCEPGTELNFKNECVDCPAGTAPFYVHECWPCRAGTYAPLPKSGTCTKCAAPKVVKNRTSCEYCPPSFHYVGYPDQQVYPNEREAECVKCEAGTYSGFEDSGCHKCAAGKVVNADQTGCI